MSIKTSIIPLSIIILVHMVYVVTLLHSPWLSLDDPYYVLHNEYVRSGLSASSIHWAFTTVYYGNWMPLTWLSYQLDASVFGLSAQGFHCTNIALATISTCFFFLFLYRVTGLQALSLCCALLYAIHPLHVEPIAWISSRKDVLAGACWMASIYRYSIYTSSPTRRNYRYLILSCCLAFCSKASTVPLAIVLLCLDYWPLRRLSRLNALPLFREKLPILALGLVSLVPTFVGQSAPGRDLSAGYLDLSVRLRNAIFYLGEYFRRAILPNRLAIEYPHLLDDAIPTPYQFALAAFLIVVLISILFRKRAPWLLAGIGWFVFSISLNLQLMQIGNQSLADRHMFIPLAGILLVITWSVWQLPTVVARVSTLIGLGVIYLSITLSLLATWQNPILVFKRATALYPEAVNAWIYLGDSYRILGHKRDAEQSYQQALTHDPHAVLAFQRLIALSKRTTLSSRMQDWLLFEKREPATLSLSDNAARALILTYAISQDPYCQKNDIPCDELAATHLNYALQKAPQDAQLLQAAHLLGSYWYKTSQEQRAIPILEHLIHAQPARTDTHLLLADSLRKTGSPQKAKAILAVLQTRDLTAEEKKQFEYLSQQLAVSQ